MHKPYSAIASIIMEERQTGITNRSLEQSEFEEMIDIFDNIRSRKDYDWMSDLKIPEYMSQLITQSAIDANTYFKTREYTEAYLDDEDDNAILAAKSAKKLVNTTLNQKHLRHYSKYMRGRNLNYLDGKVVARCWWEQEFRTGVVGTETITEKEVDTLGQVRDVEVEKPVMGEIPVVDRFHYDILDPRNVTWDDSYAYSLQDKKWIIVSFERTLEELKADAEEMSYINLDKLEAIDPPEETDVSRDSYNAEEPKTKSQGSSKSYDIHERHGTFWVRVVKRIDPDDDTSEPVEVEYGLKHDGTVHDDAEEHEMLITVAASGSSYVVIRHDLQPYMDSEGNRYRPIIRGLNMIHPTRDGGVSDGKYVAELQAAMNDAINMANDRVKMATLPTLIAKRYSQEDNETLYIQPDHVIYVDDPTSDVKEFKIESDVGSSIMQYGLFKDSMQQFKGIYPNTMGQTPELASTTATAIAGAETNTTARTNYASLTYEHTFLTELYWMILQMTWQFAHEDTARKIFGDDEMLLGFDPAGDYYYKPVTSSIETEYSKEAKIRNLTAIIGYVSNIPNPNTLKVVNMLLADVMDLMGKEIAQYKDMLMDEAAPLEGGSDQQKGTEMPKSNQTGTPQSGQEMAARNNVVNMGR